MNKEKAYLDYNATAPLHPKAREAMLQVIDEVGNASSIHFFGSQARKKIEAARRRLQEMLNAFPAEITFTSGGTEANNLAIQGFVKHRQSLGLQPIVLVSAIEHDSVRKVYPGAQELPVNKEGVIDLSILEKTLSDLRQQDKAAPMVSVMLANNETGVIQPIAEVSKIAARYGTLVHCDGVQGIGKMPIDFMALGVDLLTVSAHKCGGPQGIGALVARDGVTLSPLLYGGGQERSLRPGTENLMAICGLVSGIEASLNVEWSSIKALQDQLESTILSISPESVIFGKEASRLVNTTCITMPGVSHETQVMALDIEGVAVSAGSACSSGKVKTSHVLNGMGITSEVASTAIRISLGWQTQESDISKFITAWQKIFDRSRANQKFRDSQATVLPNLKINDGSSYDAAHLS